MACAVMHTFSPLTGENREAWRLVRLAGLREGGAVAFTLSQLRLGSKLPSLRNPLPSREREEWGRVL
jgi:hypothetical protein